MCKQTTDSVDNQLPDGWCGWTYLVVVVITKNISHLRERASACKTLRKIRIWVSALRHKETNGMIGKMHIAGFCLVGGIASRLFGIAKSPFAFAVSVPVVVMGNRRGISGRDDNRR